MGQQHNFGLGSWRFPTLITFLTLILTASGAPSAHTQISKETASGWLKSIREKADTAENTLNVAKIEDTFNSVHCDIEDIDGDTIVDGLKEAIDAVVEKCVTTADNLAKAFSETELPEEVNESSLSYYDSCSQWMPQGEKLEYSRPLEDLELIETNRGGQMSVNLSHSSVILLGPSSSHRVSIQKDIQRTAELDDVFIKNYNSENETFLQYVGTPRGVYRTYPAHPYGEDRCYPSDTTYDCRSRPWFLTAATGPKDIIVLMDGSDSMNVNGRLDITKGAVSKFINALNDGDYFNLLWFYEEVGKTVFNETLVRASAVNKNIFLQELDNIETGTGTDLAAAFQEALDMMAKSIEMGLTSSCDHIIILITDGESTDPSEVINEHPLRGDVSILTYVLGNVVDVSIIENIAQENNGIFSRIRDGGRLDIPLLSYYKFYGRGHDSWTEPYYAVSSGSLVITRSLPVYDGDSDLAGVVGVDLSLKEIERVLKRVEFNSFGYSFLTDNEGQTFYYPDIDMSAASGFYDISLFETVSDDTSDWFNEKIRRRLISRVSGSETAAKYSDKLPIIIQKQEMNYYFRPIKDSHFSVTFAIPVDQSYTLKFDSPSTWNGMTAIYGNMELYENPELREFISDDVYNDISTKGSSDKAISFMVSDYGFCNGDKPDDEIEIAKSFHDLIINDTIPPECGVSGSIFKPEFLQPIGRLITQFHDFWAEITRKGSQSSIIRAYLSTRNGIHAVYPAVTIPRDFDGVKRPWYIRASSLPGRTVLSPPYIDAVSGMKVVTISKTIALANGRMIGVAAADIGYEEMSDILDNATDFRCDKNDNVECFLLDKYGYIFCDSVRTDFPQNTFFGDIRGPIVQDLIEIGALKYKSVITPYGECDDDEEEEEEEGEENARRRDVSVNNVEKTGKNSTSKHKKVSKFTHKIGKVGKQQLNNKNKINENGVKNSGESGESEDHEGGNGECISVEYYYEFDEAVIGNEVNIGRPIITNCMQGEYYIGAIENTNLFFVMFQGPVQECTPGQKVLPEVKPIKDYWSTAGSKPVERYGKSCTEIGKHETVLKCPGSNDPIEERKVIVCGGNGDCLNGECICDPEFEIDDTLDCSLLSGSGRKYPAILALLFIFLIFF